MATTVGGTVSARAPPASGRRAVRSAAGGSSETGARWQGSFLGTAIAVIAFSLAMGYLEATVVVYLRTALGIDASVIVPVAEPGGFDAFAGIEVARELATLVMITAVGWLAGRGWLERLAWAAVVFGTWDIAYYAGLWLTVDWPPAIDTWDVLFLVPVTWVGPVWAPMAVSAALVGFGLVAAAGLRAERPVKVGRWGVTAALTGGGLVVLSFLPDAERVLAGDTSPWSGWPLYGLGMALAMAAAMMALWHGLRAHPGSPPRDARRSGTSSLAPDHVPDGP